MSDVKQLATQWLETDAAFGVAEVPIPGKIRGRVAASKPAATAVVVQKPVVSASPPASRIPAVATPPARPAPRVEKAISPAATPVKKAVVPMPAIPQDSITVLPPITRKQKETAFESLRQEIEKFAKPFLNDVSTRVVFGEGDCDASLVFVGEGPGGEEDRTGRPFVGRSGQLLDKMITAIGYQRSQVFICNVVKLRAADWTEDGSRVQDRPPNPEEVARWIPYLHKQLEIIRPKVIVTLGAPALKYVTGTTEGVTKIRGTWLAYRGIPVMPTYHPAFVLRAYTEENRRKVWEDLKAAAQKIKVG